MPSSPKRNSSTKKNSKSKPKVTQKGGAYSTEPTASGQLAQSVRSFKFIKPNQPYPLEGAPQFPPNFMTNTDCTIL